MNDLDEGAVRGLMHAGGEAPRSRVDLARVVADGRRRKARRALATGLAAAVVVLGLTGAAAVALRPAQPGAGPAAGTSGSASASPAQTPRTRRFAGGFDEVLVLRIAPGWLPAGVRERTDRTMWAAMQSLSYTDGRDKGGATEFSITLYAPGHLPRWLDPATAARPGAGLAVTTSPAPALGAGDARWYTVAADPHTTGLLWQWAPGAWATVEGKAPGPPGENRAMWRHIAERLGTDGRRAVPVGLTVVTAAPVALVGMDRGTDPVTGGPQTTLVLADHAYVPPPSRDGPGYRVTLRPDGQVDQGGLDARVVAIARVEDWTTDPVP
ncbi:hypothetical protein AB0M46_01715 [Dactylosporangium sp. NPDC051485]|uniref:hypothetical protein n=1 Tax=Dactylosporangium sp. NPDC051485 TaxID=3154846 RepID=UPI00342990E5